MTTSWYKENHPRWFSQETVGRLVAVKQSTELGVDGVTRMMVAAYQQRTAIGCLLDIIDAHTLRLSAAEKEKVAKIRKQYNKNMKEGVRDDAEDN